MDKKQTKIAIIVGAVLVLGVIVLVTNEISGGATIKPNCDINTEEYTWVLSGKSCRIYDIDYVASNRKLNFGTSYIEFTKVDYESIEFSICKPASGKSATIKGELAGPTKGTVYPGKTFQSRLVPDITYQYTPGSAKRYIKICP